MSDFWWQILVTVASVLITGITLKVDMMWLKEQVRHHVRNDEQQFAYIQQRMNELGDRQNGLLR